MDKAGAQATRVLLRLDNGSIITTKSGSSGSTVLVPFDAALRQGRGSEAQVQRMKRLLERLREEPVQQPAQQPVPNGVHATKQADAKQQLDPVLRPSSPKRARTQPADARALEAVGGSSPAEWVSACRKIIERVRRSLTSRNLPIFNEPVDRVLYPAYYTVVKQPICIKQIEQKLEAGVYSSPQEFHSDFLLMWSNCRDFNLPGSPVRLLGDANEQVFLKAWKNFLHASSKRGTPAAAPTAVQQSVLSGEPAGSDLASNRSKRRIKPKLPFEPEDVRRQSSIKAEKSGRSQVATSSLSIEERIRELYKVLTSLEEADMAKVYELVNTDPGFVKHVEDQTAAMEGDSVELQLEVLSVHTIGKLEDMVRTQFRAQLPRYAGKARRSSSRSTQTKQQQQRNMSSERKENLMNALQKLIESNESHQAEILRIVKETNALEKSRSGDDDAGYELDFGALDAKTLWALDGYVKSNVSEQAWAEYEAADGTAADSSGNSSSDSDSGSDSD